jgi:hypothetical protein
MFEKMRLKPYLEILKNGFRQEKRLGGCKFRSVIEDSHAFVQTTALGKVLSEDLGPEGCVTLLYDIKEKLLTLQFYCSFHSEDPIGEIYTSILDDSLEEEDEIISEYVVANYTDTGRSGYILKSTGVDKTNIEERIRYLFSHSNNWLDMAWEEVQEECGEGEE